MVPRMLSKIPIAIPMVSGCLKQKRAIPWRILTVLLYMVCHGSHQYTPFMLAFFYQHHGSYELWNDMTFEVIRLQMMPSTALSSSGRISPRSLREALFCRRSPRVSLGLASKTEETYMKQWETYGKLGKHSEKSSAGEPLFFTGFDMLFFSPWFYQQNRWMGHFFRQPFIVSTEGVMRFPGLGWSTVHWATFPKIFITWWWIYGTVTWYSDLVQLWMPGWRIVVSPHPQKRWLWWNWWLHRADGGNARTCEMRER